MSRKVLNLLILSYNKQDIVSVFVLTGKLFTSIGLSHMH